MTTSTLAREFKASKGYLANSEAKWLMQFRSKTLMFYLRPLVAKWLKTFKSPSILMISESPMETDLWEKRLKPRSIKWMNFSEVMHHERVETETWEMIILFRQQLAEADVARVLPKLRKGGALLLVTQNMFDRWAVWQPFLTEQAISQLYPVGFHPHGAVAWWPFQTVFLNGLGVIIDGLASLAPGRYERALRWGKCWVIRGFKRDDITVLT